jgi:hypothetical protein
MRTLPAGRPDTSAHSTTGPATGVSPSSMAFTFHGKKGTPQPRGGEGVPRRGGKEKGPSAPELRTEGPAPCSGATRPVRKASTVAGVQLKTLRRGCGKSLLSEQRTRACSGASVSLPPDLAVERNTHVTYVTASEERTPGRDSMGDFVR